MKEYHVEYEPSDLVSDKQTYDLLAAKSDRIVLWSQR